MTKPMTGKEFADGLIAEIEKRKRSPIQTNLSWDTLAELVRDVLDPKPEPERHIPVFVPPVIPREYPKLKVLYAEKDAHGKGSQSFPGLDGKEFIVVNNATEEELYHAGRMAD